MFSRISVLASIAFLASSAVAQSQKPNPQTLIARLTYQNTYGINEKVQGDSPHICFALYRRGFYRLTRMTENDAVSLQGMLSSYDFNRLDRYIQRVEAITPNKITNGDNGILRDGSESFLLDVPVQNSPQPLIWINHDHRHPFPEAVSSIIDWLQDFQAPDSSPLMLRELSDEPVCPPASEKTLKPIIANNIPRVSSDR